MRKRLEEEEKNNEKNRSGTPPPRKEKRRSPSPVNKPLSPKLDNHRKNEEAPVRSPPRQKQEKIGSLTPKLASPIPQASTASSELEKKKKSAERKKERSPRSVKPVPVVRLRSSSDEEQFGDENEKEEEEEDKEVRMLRLLKSGLAAKAKESLQRKMPKQTLDDVKTKTPSPKYMERKQIDADVFDIKVLPLRRDKSASPKDNALDKDDFNISNTNGKTRSVSSSKSRSRSKSRRSGTSSRSSLR